MSRRLGSEPLERRTVTEEIRERLTNAIESGVLPLGQRLPAERVLSEEFGVARTSVREAIQGLLSTGQLVRRSNRIIVPDQLPNIDFDTEQSTVRLAELFEVRLVIEVPIAELAAERADAAARKEITALARQFKATMPIAEFQESNRTFHWAVAKAAHNSLLSELFGKVLEALSEAEQAAWPPDGTRAARLITSQSASDHRAIAQAIRSGDAKLAGQLAEAHLHQMERSSLRIAR
ncbi:MAG TPA: FCD domain-containing protein [Acidimicrobiales bacterium]|jgi:GntR family transcriptional repressor for pyruvate dehydrogenase complex|nr:FCD domain-containing protein [Acidimicrobiales bacterium]